MQPQLRYVALVRVYYRLPQLLHIQRLHQWMLLVCEVLLECVVIHNVHFDELI